MRRSRMWLASLGILALLAGSILAAGPAFGTAQMVIPPAGARWTPLVAGAQMAPVQVAPIQTTAQMTRLRLTLPGYHELAVTKQGMTFARFIIGDSGRTTEVGMPEMPVTRRFVAVPEGATATVTVTPGPVKTVGNVTVFPAQRPVPEQGGALEMPFEMNRAFYAQKVKYPAQLARVSAPMMLGRTRVVLLDVAPMQYTPGDKTLSIYQDIQVQVSFSRAAATLGPTLSQVQHVTDVIGADIFGGVHVADLGPWDYLIICADAYRDAVQPLVDWKQAKGLKVRIYKTSEVGSAPAAIHDFVRNAFLDHNLRYLLLVGDTDTIPPFMYNGSSASDYYYALVSGDDLLPDLAVGRISAHSAAEVANIVNKSVEYEKHPSTPSLDWYKRATCISDQGYFQDTSNWVATFLGGHGYTVQKLYQSMGNANVTNVSAAVNEGRAIVNYRGHGGQTGWSTTGFSNSNVNALTNGRMLPVIISPTCLTGCYDYSGGDCYSETWVKSYAASAPRGAVSYWGSSRISYGGYNDELCKGSYKAIFDDGLHAMGDVTNKAKLYMITACGLDDTAHLELYLFNLFGDPELNVRTEKPAALPMAAPVMGPVRVIP